MTYNAFDWASIPCARLINLLHNNYTKDFWENVDPPPIYIIIR